MAASADGGHGDGAKRKGSMPPMNRPIITIGSPMLRDSASMRWPCGCGGLDVGRDEGQGGQRGRADGEALADGGGGVAERVEGVGDLADLGPRPAISAMPPALSAIGP
jgi:hypothetical protein